MLLRVVYIGAGLFLAINAIYVIVHLILGSAYLTLALLVGPLLAAFALGTMLVIKNVKKTPPEPDKPSEVGREIS